MYLYHCSHAPDLADVPLQAFDGASSPVRGLCLSDTPQEQYGPHTYRVEVPDDYSFLNADMLGNIERAPEGRITYPVNRAGEEITIGWQEVEQAVRRAMAQVELDPQLYEDVYACAIEDDGCSENDRLEGEGVDGWMLQSVRALTAFHLGLSGAEIQDDTGMAFITADPGLALDKVAYDHEDEHDADDCGYYVVAPSYRRAGQVATKEPSQDWAPSADGGKALGERMHGPALANVPRRERSACMAQ